MEVLDTIETPSQSNLKLAPLWTRLAAAIIDLIVLLIGFYGFLVVVVSIIVVVRGARHDDPQEASDIQNYYFMLGVLGFSSAIILSFLYFAILESSWKQATLGKILFGIRVGKANGEKMSFANSSGRYLAKVLSVAILLIGCIIAAFNPKRQALHDNMASTCVFRR